MKTEIFCTCDNYFMGGTDYHCYCHPSKVLEVAKRMKERASRANYKNVFGLVIRHSGRKKSAK